MDRGKRAARLLLARGEELVAQRVCAFWEAMMDGEAALETYLSDAAAWDSDRAAALQRSARSAWFVACAATLVALLAVGAVFMLTPLKRVDPFLVRVDNSTGIVDVVPVYAGAGEMSEPVTRYLLQTFVSARERFVYAMAESDYALVGSFQDAALNQAWSATWARQNPESPLNLYQDGTTLRIQVTAVSFLKRGNGLNDLAQVRFLRATRAGGVGAEQFSHWISTVQYCYVSPSKNERLRALNPLGFRVLDYRREPEVLSDSPAGDGSRRGGLP